MIVSRADARRIIRAAYGPEFAFRILAKSCTIGCRPVSDPNPTLCWYALDAGKDSAVKLGVMRPDTSIDWDCSLTLRERHEAAQVTP